jgi:hypothetical protein
MAASARARIGSYTRGNGKELPTTVNYANAEDALVVASASGRSVTAAEGCTGSAEGTSGNGLRAAG